MQLPPFFITEPIYVVDNHKLKYPLVILLSQPIEATEELFLTKILQAIGLNLGQCKILYPQPTDTFEQINLADFILAFGVNFEQTNVSLNIQPYKILIVQNTKIIAGDNLKTLSQSTELKKRLWAELQLFFQT